MSHLNGKVALVTGASRGIGNAIARRLAADGAHVIAHYGRSRDGAEALVPSVRSPLTVLGEPTGLAPCVAHYGYLETLLKCTGLRAHAALPHAGANAIHAMLAWMMTIIDAGQNMPFAENLAINPREIHGGEPYFVVAEQCEALMDFHVPPEVDFEPMETVIEEAREAVAGVHSDVTMAYKRLFWAPG